MDQDLTELNIIAKPAVCGWLFNFDARPDIRTCEDKHNCKWTETAQQFQLNPEDVCSNWDYESSCAIKTWLSQAVTRKCHDEYFQLVEDRDRQTWICAWVFGRSHACQSVKRLDIDFGDCDAIQQRTQKTRFANQGWMSPFSLTDQIAGRRWQYRTAE